MDAGPPQGGQKGNHEMTTTTQNQWTTGTLTYIDRNGREATVTVIDPRTREWADGPDAPTGEVAVQTFSGKHVHLTTVSVMPDKQGVLRLYGGNTSFCNGRSGNYYRTPGQTPTCDHCVERLMKRIAR